MSSSYTPLENEYTTMNESQQKRPSSLKRYISRLRQPKYGIPIAVVASLLILGAIRLIFGNQPSGEVALDLPQATVTITTNGFLPAQLQVKPGTTVSWVNNTSMEQAVGAIPYPSHTTLPQLVSGSINPHTSYSFVFNQMGTWHYEDDQNPMLNGTVVVEN
jgi:plastocyanin